MTGSAKGIRAGRAFVELFADDSKLVRGLRRASAKLKAFGESVRNMGLKLAALDSAVATPLPAAAWAAAQACSIRVGIRRPSALEATPFARRGLRISKGRRFVQPHNVLFPRRLSPRPNVS